MDKPRFDHDDETTPVDNPTSGYAPWLVIAKIEQARGVHEEPGLERDNPRILEYLKTVGHFPHDETPWCSAFANWCMGRVGLLGTGRPNALSWLTWGDEIKVPQTGCIAVFSRPPDPAHGHVAFYCGETQRYIDVLGGNQGNAVGRSFYPKSRLLSYRWPKAQNRV